MPDAARHAKNGEKSQFLLLLLLRHSVRTHCSATVVSICIVSSGCNVSLKRAGIERRDYRQDLSRTWPLGGLRVGKTVVCAAGSSALLRSRHQITVLVHDTGAETNAKYSKKCNCADLQMSNQQFHTTDLQISVQPSLWCFGLQFQLSDSFSQLGFLCACSSKSLTYLVKPSMPMSTVSLMATTKLSLSHRHW